MSLERISGRLVVGAIDRIGFEVVDRGQILGAETTGSAAKMTTDAVQSNTQDAA
jgi:hypothetical protein